MPRDTLGQEETMKIEPGTYPDIPMSEYGQWEAANYSTLKKFDRTAAHAREMLLNPPEQTKPMALGSATHAAVLEPELFRTSYSVAPVCDRRTTKGKKTWADFLADNEGKEVLTSGEYDQCFQMQQSAFENPLVFELVSGEGYTEFSFVWVDKDTGVLCKGRIDRFGRLWGHSVIADLKTTENASPDAWAREVVKYQYHAQSAFYLDGLDTCSPSIVRRFIWIALEKKPPYALAIYEPDAATLDKGRRMYRNYLRQWAKCQETNVWPGYDAGIQPLLLPDWALRQEEGEDE
jgi:exodeoxyribonuclease VIII